MRLELKSRRQGTEVRRQKLGDRSQNTEVRRQKAEDSSEETGISRENNVVKMFSPLLNTEY